MLLLPEVSKPHAETIDGLNQNGIFLKNQHRLVGIFLGKYAHFKHRLLEFVIHNHHIAEVPIIIARAQLL